MASRYAFQTGRHMKCPVPKLPDRIYDIHRDKKTFTPRLIDQVVIQRMEQAEDAERIRADADISLFERRQNIRHKHEPQIEMSPPAPKDAYVDYKRRKVGKCSVKPKSLPKNTQQKTRALPTTFVETPCTFEPKKRSKDEVYAVEYLASFDSALKQKNL